ncbi:MAG: TRIC cation channel family protein, partial [Rhodanobacter sp.]
MNEQMLFNLVDLAGTFAFAISGATAARRCNLDLFGILAIAYITACGGGIARDLCIGAIPPAGLSDWRY